MTYWKFHGPYRVSRDTKDEQKGHSKERFVSVCQSLDLSVSERQED